MTLLVYCAWETRAMCNNAMKNMGKKAALRVLQNFWSSIEEDWFEAQVLDCVSVILNYTPSLAYSFRDEYVAYVKRSEFYRKPASTAYGKQFFSACVALKLIDLKGLCLGGLCGSQFGWPTQQLHSVDVRRLSIEEAEELGKRGAFHWYSPDYFTTEQLTHLLSGGTVRVTFGIFDVERWEVEEVLDHLED